MIKAVSTVTRGLFGVLAASMLWALISAAPAVAWTSGGCTQSNPCSLAFTADGQPAGTTVNTTITPGFDSPQAGPVKVEVLNASGQPVTNSRASITIAITPTANPGSGTLSGTTTVSATYGIASFSGLSINQSGIGYTLTATSPGMNSATSADFTIWGSLQGCSTPPCSASASSAKTSGTVSTSSAAQDQILGAGVGGASYSCGGTYRPVSDPFAFDILSGSGVPQPNGQFSATLQIDKSLVKSSGHPGASSWQICYASAMPFTAQPGTSASATIGGVPFNTGLLPDCSSTQGAPCVRARHKTNAGDVIVTFLASGDPVGKG
jgi:hypothetical protein